MKRLLKSLCFGAVFTASLALGDCIEVEPEIVDFRVKRCRQLTEKDVPKIKRAIWKQRGGPKEKPGYLITTQSGRKLFSFGRDCQGFKKGKRFKMRNEYLCCDTGPTGACAYTDQWLLPLKNKAK